MQNAITNSNPKQVPEKKDFNVLISHIFNLLLYIQRKWQENIQYGLSHFSKQLKKFQNRPSTQCYEHIYTHVDLNFKFLLEHSLKTIIVNFWLVWSGKNLIGLIYSFFFSFLN